MLLAVAGPARGRSHTSRTGNDANDLYRYYDSRHYFGSDNSTGSAFGFIFDECDVSDESDQDDSPIHYVTLVVFPLLLLQGIIGNLLAIPVLVSLSRSAWSSVLYLACLGGMELVMLLVQCGDSWYQEIVKTSLSRRIIDSSDAACKTYYFLYMCMKHLIPWLMVAISVEMLIATRWPKRTYFMCTLERARNVLMLIGIIIVCLDINHFWTFGVPKPGVPCVYMAELSENFTDWIWPALDTTVELILPIVTVSICFFLTASTMIQRPANEKRDLDSEMKNYFLELATLRDFRTVCFILCLIFMCLSVSRITYTLATLSSYLSYLDVDCLTFKIFKTVDMTFTFVFYSAKIYLYIAFSASFRAKLKEGFDNACKKFQRCCRIVCVCGHKWTPVNPQDKGEDTKMLPAGQGTSRMHDSNLGGDFSKPGKNNSQCKPETHDAIHGKSGYTQAKHKDDDISNGQDDLNRRDLQIKRNLRGNSPSDLAATKV